MNSKQSLWSRWGRIESEARSHKKLIAVGALVVILLAVSGAVYIRTRQSELRAAVHQQLSAIADLKLRQITNWRTERLSDARFFLRARFAARDLQRFLDHPDPESRAAVLQWLALLKGDERYEAAIVFDTRLARRLAIPESAGEPTGSVRAYLARALQAHDVILTDLHRDQSNGFIHLDIIFPIFKNADPMETTPIAVVLLKLDSRQFLFPLVQSWPTSSRTAETMLIRRDGDNVLYLNDLRNHPAAALRLRLPLASPNLATARVLRGEPGPFEGEDYSGVPVVAVGRMVPDTTWAMVVKVDQHELYAPLRNELLRELAALVGLLVISVLTVGLFWRRRTSQFLQKELGFQKERAALAERLADLMRNANDIILILDSEGRVIEANECALKSYGYAQTEIQKKRLLDLVVPDKISLLESNQKELDLRGSAIFQTEHRRKDGGTFPVEVSSRKIGAAGDKLVLSIVRDISERKRAEHKIQELNLALRERNAELEARVAHRTSALTQTVQSLEAEARERARAQEALSRANQQLHALALELARAEEQERNRISQVLHDHLQQLIVAANLNLSLLGGRLTDKELKDAVASAMGALDEAVNECRSLTVELTPPLLKGGLAAAFSWLAELMKCRYGLSVRTQLSEGTEPKDPGVSSLLFQSVREALFNVVKHAGVAEAVLIMSRPDPSTLRIEVADKGAGFDPARLEERNVQAGQSGFGLFSIRSRLQSLGGEMEVQSVPSQGTRIILVLPLGQPCL